MGHCLMILLVKQTSCVAHLAHWGMRAGLGGCRGVLGDEEGVLGGRVGHLRYSHTVVEG